MPRYDAARIEKRWQEYWEEHGTFVTPNEPPADATGKLYALDMFPYPSGSGLHVGHPEGYTATDIVSRHARMLGKRVLHCMGWDSFGLPAEQYAIETGTHPRVTTEKNISTFRRQLKSLGFSYDWSRELATTDPEYFRWTQWIFLQLWDTWYDATHEWTGPDGRQRTGKGRPIAELPIPDDVTAAGEDAVRHYQDEHRLAYQSNAPVNWCPALGTVLANEEVTADGKSERGNHPVERRALRQWMLRITAYAERLLDELEDLDWAESIKALQRNWIGKSTGAEVDFYVPRAESGKRKADFEQWEASRKESGFPATPGDDVLRVYTTRPDTLHGATYMVIAPEHPFVDRLTTPEQKEAVEAYVKQASVKSDLDRTDLAKEKTGVFTGSHAVNPVNGVEVPIWIADYVLVSYGTGAIMAVPAHDLRDWEFAVTFDLPIVPVVQPPDGHEPTKDEKPLGREIDGEMRYPFAGHGTAVNSADYDGLPTAEFKTKITADLAAAGVANAAVNYRLRDWLFSRQRYWGEPFPVWHELDDEGNPTGRVRPVDESELPVELPEMEDFKPKGTPEPPLSFAPDDWLYRTAEDGTKLRRETNSMPQWAGSCWYFLRFCDPKNTEAFIDPEIEKHWMPIDLYIGGAEHAVLHLLYSRFWNQVLFDRGHLSHAEPFRKLVNQGMILGEAELTGFAKAESGKRKAEAGDVCSDFGDYEWVSSKDVTTDGALEGADGVVTKTGEPVVSVKLDPELVEKKGESFVFVDDSSIRVDSRAHKMSKSRGNVVNPDDVVRDYGADSLRLYEMFMGPLEQTKPWSMSGVEGVYRFLGRVWRMFVDDRAEEVVLDPAVQDVDPTEAQERILHKTIKAVGDDIDKLSFNTAISRMMEFTNELGGQNPRPRAVLEPFVLLLAPFAPHLAEELWHLLGHDESLTFAPWPTYDESKLVEATIEIPVQVNGKLRAKIQVPNGADKETMQSLAEADETVAAQLAGKTVVKTIVVPGRMVNFVVKP